ncbi:NAD-dependent deacetylase sirtuin-2 [Plakobranchus ocellatus]|uniref:NAD-dependent deacetylase sirtuin-2 n=1 Tax=Plakobranchus ocellatus TaxID=259542 RepID=A0AAV4ACX8_9GAST|nr:NAD-dependent deacetylase sirtuin-2 [Plakobranchus ocellatus]
MSVLCFSKSTLANHGQSEHSASQCFIVVPPSRCPKSSMGDIVFFGESLPQRFATAVNEDFKKCDLLIVTGTSLMVQPFASLTTR